MGVEEEKKESGCRPFHEVLMEFLRKEGISGRSVDCFLLLLSQGVEVPFEHIDSLAKAIISAAEDIGVVIRSTADTVSPRLAWAALENLAIQKHEAKMEKSQKDKSGFVPGIPVSPLKLGDNACSTDNLVTSD